MLRQVTIVQTSGPTLGFRMSPPPRGQWEGKLVQQRVLGGGVMWGQALTGAVVGEGGIRFPLTFVEGLLCALSL